jgi:hypothetical protein
VSSEVACALCGYAIGIVHGMLVMAMLFPEAKRKGGE